VAERAASGLRTLFASHWLWPVLALVLAAVGLLELLRPGVVEPARVGLVVVLLCAPVGVAPRSPLLAAAAMAFVIAFVPSGEGSFPDSPLMAQAAIAYACGAYGSRWAGSLGAALLLVTTELVVGFPDDVFIPFLLATAAPWWVGMQVRDRRRLVSDLADRNRELEAEQDAFARLSVRRERARIARELHDIVAHHLAVIVIQAGAGRMADPGRVDEAAERFRSIRQSGDQALTEMACLVDVLHADKEADAGDRLRLLLDDADARGLELRVTHLPADVRLPADAEDAAYRVVQEGLTNAMKHAPGAEVDVRLGMNGDSLEIVVRNRGDSRPSTLADSGSGLGLTGMRERIESAGGRLDAGPDGDGWCLQARLPVSSAALVPAK
jgi:signal transduction histidine kinase